MNSHLFSCRKPRKRVGRRGPAMRRGQFCARLSAFKMLGLFFCNSIDPSAGIDRRRHFESGWIFGEECEIQVTLHNSSNI
jgi:hypothetical protein